MRPVEIETEPETGLEHEERRGRRPGLRHAGDRIEDRTLCAAVHEAAEQFGQSPQVDIGRSGENPLKDARRLALEAVASEAGSDQRIVVWPNRAIVIAHWIVACLCRGDCARAPRANEFLSRAIALIVPIDWPEPFGLVIVEAMACGAPVVAFDRGAVPELIEDGVTGFVVEDETSAVGAIRHLSRLSRTAIRKRFEERFTARRMARDYLSVYRDLLGAAALRPRIASISGSCVSPSLHSGAFPASPSTRPSDQGGRIRPSSEKPSRCRNDR